MPSIMTSEGFEGGFGLGVDAGEYGKAHVLDGVYEQMSI
jgi:hypothetical protein